MADCILPPGLRWDDELHMGRETAALTARVWPRFLTAPSDLPEPGLKFEISAAEYRRRFPVWGVRREVTTQLVAFAHAVQLAVDVAAPTLPEDGWTFAIRAAAGRAAPNCLCLLLANVDPSARGMGLASILIERAKLQACHLGFHTLIAPVRPTRKHAVPHMPIEDYLAQRTAQGEMADPWLATHARAGAQVVNVCARSVQVRASLHKWREWTAQPLAEDGAHVLDGGLTPLKVDLEAGIGTYIEPNIWMRYTL